MFKEIPKCLKLQSSVVLGDLIWQYLNFSSIEVLNILQLFVVNHIKKYSLAHYLIFGCSCRFRNIHKLEERSSLSCEKKKKKLEFNYRPVELHLLLCLDNGGSILSHQVWVSEVFMKNFLLFSSGKLVQPAVKHTLPLLVVHEQVAGECVGDTHLCPIDRS